MVQSISSIETRTVVVMGLGFVGSAMAVATAMSQKYKVIGLDLPTPEGLRRANALANGDFPFATGDAAIVEGAKTAAQSGLLTAVTTPSILKLADIVIVDVHLDLEDAASEPTAQFDSLSSAIQQIGEYAKQRTLVLVETTVPPGTCEKIVAPLLNHACRQRGLSADSLLLAHSYERVMPGNDYLNSIRSFWRVYAGNTKEAAAACKAFLETVINTSAFPLVELENTTASETAKILENSYRATNIAFIEEWGKFAEEVGIDLFSIIDAIRMRPTHSNIRHPGLGVGGYCLTKDPLFGIAGSKQNFGLHCDFPFSRAAVTANSRMPLHSAARLEEFVGGNLNGLRIALMGVSYKCDVADTRHSASQPLVEEIEIKGGKIECFDPHIDWWQELNRPVSRNLPDPKVFDVVIFAVPHAIYRQLNIEDWLSGSRPLIFDANAVLQGDGWNTLSRLKIRYYVIGRGGNR